MFEPQFQLPPFTPPASLPVALPQPRFQIGERVRWQAVPSPDFGRVVGVIYTGEATHQASGLHYLILLDEQSPSHSICIHDFALEEDIEHFEQEQR
ncbi:MAG TPA: hypothetical protein V6D10_15785 [Trichocoleus sp.]|jgi:hypothetical protein